jgi:hypothetical protein
MGLRVPIFGSISTGLVVGGRGYESWQQTGLGSEDGGTTWTILQRGDGQDFDIPYIGLLAGGYLLTAPGYQAACSVGTTATGIWDFYNTKPNYEWSNLTGLAYFKGDVYAAFSYAPDGTAGILKATSLSPLTWAIAYSGDSALGWTGATVFLAHDGNRLFSVTENGWAKYSDDGATWSAATRFTTEGDWQFAVCGNGWLVVVGGPVFYPEEEIEFPHKIYAADTATMTFAEYEIPGLTFNSNNWNARTFVDITFASGVFTAVAYDGTMIRFADPANIRVTQMNVPAGFSLVGVKHFESL